MTTTPDPIAAIERALEGVKHSEWFMSPWHVEEDASAVRHTSDGSYICNASSDKFATYIAACNPVAITALLALARQAAEMKHALVELADAAGEMLKGLDARIQAAPGNAVPVFHGIVDLSDAFHRARSLATETSDAR